MLSHRQLANAIRFLSIDAVQRANSGHPGMPMGMADIAEVLWGSFLHHNPANPHWINRDRFVLSNGHGSMLLYSILNLTGYDLSIDDLKNFRQLHSKTPGHPEVGLTPGIETTTGPLGQGLANAVGMAIGRKLLADQFNRDEYKIIDHWVYAFAGDGCLMEGISHEACSLAGALKLGKLIVFWDDNGISIDGETKFWFNDDVPKRFAAYHWHVIPDVDGHDAAAVKAAILQAQQVTDQPTLICCRTTIGFGSGLEHCATCHGAPLGDEEIKVVRKNLNWEYPPFVIPPEIYAAWDAKKRGNELENQWQKMFADYQTKYPELAKELIRRTNKKLPNNFATTMQNFITNASTQTKAIATRKASQEALEVLGKELPELIGGSADLTESNLTAWSGSRSLNHGQKDANYIHYGVREFGMSAIMNGLALYGGFIPYGGTFLVFYTYAANAIRMAALMKQRVIFVYSHDSIGLGEDGPTHQPIEQLTALRTIPNLSVWRPCDLVETAVAWQSAIENETKPTALLLSRQALPAQTHHAGQIAQIKRGGYVLLDCNDTPDCIIMATGSEVGIAISAAETLRQEGIKIRVVSLPSTDVFLQQERSYQEDVLPKNITRRVAIEAGSSDYWHKFIGSEGRIIGIDHYGESAPAKDLFKLFGFTAENIVAVVKSIVK